MMVSKRLLSRESRGDGDAIGVREPARQAGGHWFEPSTAHRDKSPADRAFSCLSGQQCGAATHNKRTLAESPSTKKLLQIRLFLRSSCHRRALPLQLTPSFPFSLPDGSGEDAGAGEPLDAYLPTLLFRVSWRWPGHHTCRSGCAERVDRRRLDDAEDRPRQVAVGGDDDPPVLSAVVRQGESVVGTFAVPCVSPGGGGPHLVCRALRKCHNNQPSAP